MISKKDRTIFFVLLAFGLCQTLGLNIYAAESTVSTAQFIKDYFIFFAGIFVLVFLAIVAAALALIKENEAKEELKKVQEALQSTTDLIETSNAERSSFIYNMSHELRTPLNSIIGFTERAKKKSDDKEILMDCLDKVGESSKYLLSVISDVLDIASINSGNMIIEEEPVNIINVANSIIDSFNETAAAKNISIELDYSNVRDYIVYQDEYRIRQICIQIIDNSIKFTNEGGKIKISIDQLETKNEGSGKYLFKLEDNGIGMSKNFVKNIYDSFHRENIKGSGAGLGMSLVKKITDKLGGVVNVESELGKGTTVTLEFEFKLGELEEIKDSSLKGIPQNGNLNDIKVLLVEDNELNMEIFTEILQDMGMLVTQSVNGADAVEKVRSSEPCDFDIIIMDIQMPILDGYAAATIIRGIEKPELSKIPIIAMTANEYEDTKRQALDAGIDYVLNKPVNANEIYKTIYKLIKL